MTERDENVSPRARAEALREKALPLLATGAFPEALALYDEALGLARETHDDAFVDWMYACRAAAAVESGGADEVLVELKRVLLRTADPATAFRASYSAARVYELRRDFKKALFYNRIARQHASSLEDALLFAGAEKQGGTFLTLESRFDDAAEAYRHALELTAPPVSVPEIFRALLKDELGYCLISLDRTEEGLALVHEALETLEREGAGASPNVAYLLMDLCFGYLKLDRYAEARYFGELGLERAPSTGDPSVERSLLYLVGEACHLSGNTSAAEGYFDRLAGLYPEFKNLRAYLEVFDFRNVINLRS